MEDNSLPRDRGEVSFCEQHGGTQHWVTDVHGLTEKKTKKNLKSWKKEKLKKDKLNNCLNYDPSSKYICKPQEFFERHFHAIGEQ